MEKSKNPKRVAAALRGVVRSRKMSLLLDYAFLLLTVSLIVLSFYFDWSGWIKTLSVVWVVVTVIGYLGHLGQYLDSKKRLRDVERQIRE
ncbi:MAG TPA: hypothetical protein VMZ92_03140 [Planctomycetota bacterium]|nr:hypothetical protein [Planctomycetota bacterium]